MSSPIKLDLQNTRSLIQHDTESALINGVGLGHSSTLYDKVKSYQKLDEPAIVSSLFQYSLPEIQRILNFFLNPTGITAQIQGHFCHQRPIVTWSRASKNPELGDLFVVHMHYDNNLSVYMNSLLLQAKVSSAKGYTTNVGKSDQHQLHLYEKWPKFDYVRPQKVVGRDVTPKKAFDGAQYLLLHEDLKQYGTYQSNGFINNTSFNIAQASSSLKINKPLSEALIDFLCGDTGQQFYDRKHYKYSEWCKVCWDLLLDESTFNVRKVNMNNEPRLLNFNLSTLPISTVIIQTGSITPIQRFD
ncbi:hypothetical protein AYI83_21465 [Shewanella algae]|uniref:hypothetical protein n=1 Tax=Shewanella algae TaxID=38313 RepID=UPI001183F540|nr:hypothetical protein [Shewanella algae]TVK90680.1 hypothetical protein AYI83_21465 [Shewanella algae]